MLHNLQGEKKAAPCTARLPFTQQQMELAKRSGGEKAQQKGIRIMAPACHPDTAVKRKGKKKGELGNLVQ